MNRALLVAKREYRAVTATRSYRVSLIILPLMFIVMGFAATMLRPSGNGAYMLLDRSGRYESAIPAHADDLSRTELPANVNPLASQREFASAIGPALGEKFTTADGPRNLVLAIYIPADIGAPGANIHAWTSAIPSGAASTLIGEIRDRVTNDLRARQMETFGLDAPQITQLQTIAAPITITALSPGGGPSARLVLPVVSAYLLLMASIVSGSLLLQGLIEERSSKLLESLLACVNADELMRGKLLGVGTAGLTLIGAWIACALLGVNFFHSGSAMALRTALASIQSPLLAFEILFYFLAGFLVIGMLFLAVGAMSDSMQDAQGYLGPMMMALMLPSIFMISSGIVNPASMLPKVMTWIPIYTPFAMMLRLGNNAPPAVILGSGALLIIFIWIEITLLGRVFRASLLHTGTPPKIGEIVRFMLAHKPSH
jgi:ABC-2 type transport system permease protein